jgi:hypothetical protein
MIFVPYPGPRTQNSRILSLPEADIRRETGFSSI